MMSPTSVVLQTKNRVAIEARRRWLLLVPGVLLLTAHLLPVPQNGALGGLPTFCPFKNLSGWPCPGCGLTRAIVLCAHGDWASAFLFHPLSAVFYGGLWLALALGVLPVWRTKPAISQRAWMLVAIGFAAAMLVVWMIRLTGIFPYPNHF